jgi:hypothetical protein
MKGVKPNNEQELAPDDNEMQVVTELGFGSPILEQREPITAMAFAAARDIRTGPLSAVICDHYRRLSNLSRPLPTWGKEDMVTATEQG